MRSLALTLLACTHCLSCKGGDKKPEPKAKQAQMLPSDSDELPRATNSNSVKVVEPETMVLRDVLLETSDPETAREFGTGDLAKQLGATLVRSGWLAARDREVPEGHRIRPVEARISLSYEVTLDKPGAILVAVEASLNFIDRPDELHPQVAMVNSEELTTRDDALIAAQLSTLASRTFELTASALTDRERLRRSSHEELISVLSSGLQDPGMMIWALQLAADRNLREAVPIVATALKHEEEDVRAEAVRTLVSFGDERAVELLTANVDFKDDEALEEIINAVSAIGGSDATEFLEFVASGHPSREMREQATKAALESKKQQR